MNKENGSKIIPLVMFLHTETNGLPKTKNDYRKYYSPTEIDKYDSSRIIAMSWCIKDFKGDQKTIKTYYVKPNGFEIKNQFIHGITMETANKFGINISEVFDHLNKDLKNVKVLVAHNLEFNINILLSELHRLGDRELLINKLNKLERSCTAEQSRDIIKLPLKTTYMIAKYKMPTLPELYKYCFDKEIKNHINSKKDVQYISQCFFHLLKT